MHYDETPHEPTGAVEDDRLRLLFTCCQPALAPQARIALTLRLLGGLTVAEIGHAFLVPETTMAQRSTRAKKKITAARVPYRVHEAADLPGRLGGVLTVLFLVFNEGYLATGDGDPVRAELTGEAIRLTRILCQLIPEEPEVAGLLGLLLLTEARRASRVRNGQLVPLDQQDRAGWDRTLIAEGHDLVRECLAINRPGRYQLLAAINAVHTDAPTAPDTDWSQVVALHDQLTLFDPSPIVALTARSRSRSSTARKSPSRWSAGCRSRSTTRGTPLAPTYSAGLAAALRQGRRTTPQSPPPKTPPSAPTCAGSAASWSERSNDSGMRSSAPVVSGLVIPAEYLEELRRRPIKAMTRARGPHPQI